MDEKKPADKPKQSACDYCGHKNNDGAARCSGCGINFTVGTD